MNFGENLQEQRENITIIKKYVSKFGKVFRWILTPANVLIFICLFNSVNSSQKIFTAAFGFICIISGYFFNYLCGVTWGWTWITVKSWFMKNEDLISTSASVASSTLVTSYILGGRKAARTSAIVILLMLLICISIGFYAGIFNLIKSEIILRKSKKLNFE